jgi:hypothetical protein
LRVDKDAIRSWPVALGGPGSIKRPADPKARRCHFNIGVLACGSGRLVSASRQPLRPFGCGYRESSGVVKRESGKRNVIFEAPYGY